MSKDQEAELVRKAQAGDRQALNELVATIKDMIFDLAARMLGSPSDAEDATQEILIRLVTGLRDFRHESSLRTWAYRVAANHLLTSRRRKAEEKVDSFEAMEELLAPALESPLPPLEDGVLVNEAKLRCTSGMLLALDRDHRLAFIFGEVLELPSEEGAEVLGIQVEAFRKRLSRARSRMAEFVNNTCGLVNPERPCRCARQAACAVQAGFLAKDHLVWASLPVRSKEQQAVHELDELTRATEVFRSLPAWVAGPGVVQGLRSLLESATPTVLG